MHFTLPVRLPVSRNARVVCVAILLIESAAVIARFHRGPRPWQASEVPIAFWAWRNQAPSETDVRKAIENNHARAIFLRAGQIDYQDGTLRRIRSVTGSLPRGIDLHLVYSGTRALLYQLDSINEQQLAAALAAVFQEDCNRAEQERARVAGLQIDLDVPTRLLGRYERTLKALRAQLKPGIRLSITGLPTWMQSSDLQSTLTQVDFWVPQFYGGEIPNRADQIISISSPKRIEGFLENARALDKPFYAGLSAYGYALLYSTSGSLIALRGNMDPAAIAADSNLELIDQRPFEHSGERGSEWRCTYRARADGVTDGLVIHAGDQLVVDSPSAESLRQSARIVRELAGEKLLGICVFRLPGEDDPATLNTDQVTIALADRDSIADIRVRFKANQSQNHVWLLEIENAGTASAVGGLQVDVEVDAGTIESINAERGESAETMCQIFRDDRAPGLQPCGVRRANMIRIKSAGLRAGKVLKTTVVFTPRPPEVLSFSVNTGTDTGDRYIRRTEVVTQEWGKQ